MSVLPRLCPSSVKNEPGTFLSSPICRFARSQMTGRWFHLHEVLVLFLPFCWFAVPWKKPDTAPSQFSPPPPPSTLLCDVYLPPSSSSSLPVLSHSLSIGSGRLVQDFLNWAGTGRERETTEDEEKQWEHREGWNVFYLKEATMHFHLNGRQSPLC